MDDLRKSDDPRQMVHDSLARTIFAGDPSKNAPNADAEAAIIEEYMWQAVNENLDAYNDMTTLTARMTAAFNKRIEVKKLAHKSQMPLDVKDPYE
jgi:hypothetical protein